MKYSKIFLACAFAMTCGFMTSCDGKTDYPDTPPYVQPEPLVISEAVASENVSTVDLTAVMPVDDGTFQATNAVTVFQNDLYRYDILADMGNFCMIPYIKDGENWVATYTTNPYVIYSALTPAADNLVNVRPRTTATTLEAVTSKVEPTAYSEQLSFPAITTSYCFAGAFRVNAETVNYIRFKFDKVSTNGDATKKGAVRTYTVSYQLY